jgi:hypothetical protein
MKRLIDRVVERCGTAFGIRKEAAVRAARPRMFEALEGRTMMAVFTVSNLNDTGAGSLRQAISDANGAEGADVIEFADGVSGTITLGGTELSITESLTINGPGSGLLTLDGNDASRVLRFTSGTSSLRGVTVTGGREFTGGGISNVATLGISDVVITGNAATTGGGGGIDNTGTLRITNAVISNNDGDIGDGGGIRNASSLHIEGSTISGNTAANGGAIANFGPSLTIENSTIALNTADLAGAAFINFNIMVVRNSTIANNTGASVITNSATLTLISSIIAGTNSVSMVGPFANGSMNNLIQDAGNSGGLTHGSSGNIIGVDPMLSPLAANGGLTQTMAIQAGSPAINAGVNPATLLTDQRGTGFARTRGTAIDIGAFEFSGAPTVTALGTSATYYTQGQNVVLTATGITDPDGPITSVNFYLDANNNGIADTGELIGTDTQADGGYTFSYELADDFELGSVAFLVTATDSDGLVSAVRGASATVLSSSQFASLPTQLLGASAGSSGNLNITTQNPAGQPIVLQQAGGQTTWTGSDLQAKTNSPAVIGEVVTWVDSKDGRNYAAAMTVGGLVLYTNTTGNEWTFRNLTTEVAGSQQFTGNLTVFIDTAGGVNIAGVIAGGDLQRFYQTGAGASGNYTWAAVNLGDDLRAQSLTVPQFVGRITSFVTPWNALNVVGLDADGQIQAVWWHQSLQTNGRFTTNNLSEQTGAPALTGGLTVWLTSWNAINIAGTDTNGQLSATWWVPGYNNELWNNSNLTDIVGGPELQSNSMSSWVTPWGAMNIAGREQDGTMSVYWWVPGYNNDQWQVASFRDIVPDATLTVGPVTGITALAGDNSMSILSTSEGGEVIRLWWSPTTNQWAEQNLTQLAVPA